jgi:hypothetical protein
MVLAFVILQSFKIYADKEESKLLYSNYDFATTRMPCNVDKCNSASNYIYSFFLVVPTHALHYTLKH